MNDFVILDEKNDEKTYLTDYLPIKIGFSVVLYQFTIIFFFVKRLVS